jgi:polyphenol oxidase
MFAFRDVCDVDPGSASSGTRVEVAFTDASIDLQGERDGFAGSLAAVVQATGVPFARLTQVHGADVVHVVDDPPVGPTDDVPTADALVTTRPGIGLMVRVADCVPVLLADPAAGVIGAVHAGRLGLTLDVTGRTVRRMRELGAGQIRGWIGPHVCGRCYEVPEALRTDVATLVPEARSETSWGTPALDLGAGVAAQLAEEGVVAERVGGCTLEDERLPSFRRDGAAAGRFAGLVWIA